ncbi:MAG TPA: discoidin domain-containing protein, partial [Opitutus sp.]|nr:discoidin domain-containing protein [Opitutus sp.]
PRNDGANIGFYFPIDFIIQTSPDGTTWTTRVTQTGYPQPGNSVQAFPFATVTARYVRVTATNLRFHTAYRMQFAELEVY